ncbi:hypothetical protein HN615_06870 [Candidatus Woesearchaeota archaeon]|nr:hypothetical protein [Candidatus Woesearchaeota archaeon]
MIIINTMEKLSDTFKKIRKQPLIYLQMYSDVNKHPKENRVSCYYIRTLQNEYIIPVHHNERFSEDTLYWNTSSAILVSDLKSYKHCSMINSTEVYDLNWCHYMKTNEPYDFDKHLTNAHHHNYRLHYEKENVNDVIPLVKHAEYFSNLSEDLIRNFEKDYDQTILEVLLKIEKNGIKTTDSMVFSEYNPYTSTGRPSNRFGGMNFAALNKSDGSRKQFISRHKGGVLVEFDFDAYHPRLIGDLIGYEFPNGSAHEHLAKTYGLSYDEGKSLTFKYLYGGITTEMKENPFFGMVDEYIKDLWGVYKRQDFIESDIYYRKIYRKNMQSMNPNKVFNYKVQLLETENNIRILNTLLPEIENGEYASRLVLYNYDSFLLDFDKEDGLDYLKKVKGILEQDGKYPTKVSMGDNYHEMRDITEKFNV